MTVDFSKYSDGLVPAIVQDATTEQVLMLGYMNAEALAQTSAEQRVTFYSRSKQRLWTKGETSGNVLAVESIAVDCDQDALLIRAVPAGPTCHTGSVSCFGDGRAKGFVYALERTISERLSGDDESSYTRKLAARGINKVAQKGGEEAVGLVIEAKDNNEELFLNEAADLMYHLLVLLRVKGGSLEQVEAVLRERSG